VGAVDDVCGDAGAGEAAVVNAVVVVEVEVGVLLAAQSRQARLDVACEGWSPAFVEDRLVERFDVAVGLRAAGVDGCVACLQARDRVDERALELVGVVSEQTLERPAGGLEILCDAAGEL
jgi:hypothetical protein